MAGSISSEMAPLARQLIDSGACVALAAERRSDAESLALELGHGDVYTGGLRRIEQASHCVSWVLDTCGRLDALVVAARDRGGWSRAESDGDEWLESETRGVYVLTRAALPELRRNGGGVVGAVQEGAHGSRGTPALLRWITSFMRGVAIENAKFGVRAAGAAPGADGASTCRALLGAGAGSGLTGGGSARAA